MSEKKIIVADDNLEQRYLLKNILEKKGYIVYTAKNGDECIDLILSINPQVVILDYIMPKKNGKTVFKFIKENLILMPLIIMTSSYKMTTKKYISVSKPINTNLLIEIIENYS